MPETPPDAPPQKAQILDEYRFEYVLAPGHVTVPVHGAYGGPTAFGDLALHLWAQSAILPAPLQLVALDGKFQIPDTAKFAGVQRSVVATLVLRPDAARDILVWLASRVPGVKLEMSNDPG
ncbi:MAG: hypothetical protein U1E39_13825 [Planctomycetota bacterium]